MVIPIQHKARRDAEGFVHINTDVLIGPIKINGGNQLIYRLVPIGIVQSLVGEPTSGGGQDGICQMYGILSRNPVLILRCKKDYTRNERNADDDNGSKGIQQVTEG